MTMLLNKSMNKSDKPTKAEIERVNRAIEATCRRIDKLETIAVKNRCPIRGVYYTNSPTTEFSRFRVVYRRK